MGIMKTMRMMLDLELEVIYVQVWGEEERAIFLCGTFRARGAARERGGIQEVRIRHTASAPRVSSSAWHVVL